MKIFTLFNSHRLLWLCLLVVLGAIVYFPGVSGPWLFDDYSNILRNSFLRISTLDTDSLYHAAYSLQSGPLKRPVAMLSFALNHYFAGGFEDTTSYKLTNLAIHAINGLLIFWLLRHILERLQQIPSAIRERKKTSLDVNTRAALVALLWLVHPIQLTSVLYVVQRMTELSALFVLLGMIGYLKGRMRIIEGRPHGLWLMLGSAGASLCLGMLSKENAVLLPVFLLAMEYTLFAGESPWRRWRKLPDNARYAIIAVASLAAVALLLWTFDYASTGYQRRDFTLVQRALTETRVLVFYISLIVLPRINEFGLFHDDIALSTSLVSPWTTPASIAFLAILLAVALVARRKHPLLSLGLLWFFAGHLLESTIIPLEIAHEHRNYLASLGILLALFHLLALAIHQYRNHRLWLALPAMILVFGGVTTLRASQWSNELLLNTYESLHHPESAIVQSSLAAELTRYGRYQEAKEAMHTATRLEPNEASHLIWLQMLAAREGEQPDGEVQSRLLELLATRPITPTTDMMLENAIGCIQGWCKSLQSTAETWLRTITERKDIPDRSYYSYLLGITVASQYRLQEAAEIFRRSHEDDPRYLHPLFNLAAIYIHQEKIGAAEEVLEMLRKANTANLHPRDREIGAVATDIEKLKQKLRALPEAKSAPAS